MHSHAHSHHDHHRMMMQDFKRRFIVSLIITLFILPLSPMIRGLLSIEKWVSFPYDSWVLFALSSFIFFYGGWPFLKGSVEEIKDKLPGMMTLIALAIIVAYGYSTAIVFFIKGKYFFWELATLIDIMLIGHYIEMKSIMSASNALEKLAELLPSTAHKITNGNQTQEVELGQLNPKDKVLIKPGEKIPIDGIIVQGASEINQSMLTGEAQPVNKAEQDSVIGGSINGSGSLIIEVKDKLDNSYLSKVMQLVKQAQQSKSRAQDLANKAALWLTIVAITGGAITFFSWFLFSTHSVAFALERTVSVMVITCPHALGLAIPLVIAVSTAIAAQSGLLIKNRSAFEAARNIDAIIFDKTGTLTTGEFEITDVVAFNMDEKTLLQYTASIEAHSEHPLAKALAHSSKDLKEVKDFQAMAGKGAQATIDNKNIKAISQNYLKEKNISFDKKTLEKFASEGKSLVFILMDEKPAGIIALADKPRKESKATIEALKKQHIRCIMLTGDRQAVAQSVANELGLDEFFAEILPDQKSEKVKEVKKEHRFVAMTGDGVNDAPALATADLGIAVGAGTDIAAETADVILVNSSPTDILSCILLAKATYKKTVENLIYATAYNIIAIPLAAGVLYHYGVILSPAIAALVMSFSTVVCAVNAKLLKIKN